MMIPLYELRFTFYERSFLFYRNKFANSSALFHLMPFPATLNFFIIRSYLLMDSVTQAVLGASIAGATLGRFHGRRIIATGALLATVPDLDVVIRYSDPILAMTHHRGFSHSVFVLSAVAIGLALLWRLLRPDPRYSAIYLVWSLWMILITHPLLDA